MPMLTSKNTNLNSNAQNVRNSFAKASSDNKQKSRVVVLFVLVKKISLIFQGHDGCL